MFAPAGSLWLPDHPTQYLLLYFLVPAGLTFTHKYSAATWHVLELPSDVPLDATGVSLHWLTVNSQVEGKSFGVYLSFRPLGSLASNSPCGQVIGPHIRGSDGGFVRVHQRKLEFRWDISKDSVSPAGFQCSIFVDAALVP